MPLPWWLDPTTQGFNPPIEPGKDIGTPFHTPVTALSPGVVRSETYGGFGARVDIGLPSGGIVEYYQHLDQLAPGLRVGSQVTAGQLLGLSGGQLSGGYLPNDPLNSTGPHIEVGLIGPTGRPMDPTAAIAAGPLAPAGFGSAGGGPAPGNPNPIGGGSLINFPDPVASLRDWSNSVINQGKGSLPGLMIPLVVAGLIILVVLGASDKPTPAPAPTPQIVPVPV